MTPLWTSQEIAVATQGKVSGEWEADGLCIDSRSVAIGDLFVALEGPKFDGHDFVVEALERGASSAMVSRIPTDGKQTVNNDRLVFVDDTMLGLTNLAQAARERVSAQVAAVTGSVGKTTTKNALTLVLGRQGASHATLGNLNNHWGAPLSLARMPSETRYGIFELGMNHAGEIEPLSKLVKPNVSVVTTVEAVHLEFFESVADIADAKAEIFTGLEPDGTAIIPSDNPHHDRLKRAAQDCGAKSVVSFGTDNGSAYRLIAWSVTDSGTRIAADVNGRRLVYDIGLIGKHMALNSLAVLATVDALGGDVERAAGDLNDMTPPPGRGQRSIIQFAGGAFDLIDESYNASPASITALVESLGATQRSGRAILVLGDMLELGDQSPAMHADLASTISRSGIDAVFMAGSMMKHLHDALPTDIATGYAPDSEALTPLVLEAVRPGDVLAVKGSFGSKMSITVGALKNLQIHQDVSERNVANGG